MTYSSSYTLITDRYQLKVTLVFFKGACHANPEVEKKFSGSGSYILRYIFVKFSNTSANNNVSF